MEEVKGKLIKKPDGVKEFITSQTFLHCHYCRKELHNFQQVYVAQVSSIEATRAGFTRVKEMVLYCSRKCIAGRVDGSGYKKEDHPRAWNHPGIEAGIEITAPLANLIIKED